MRPMLVLMVPLCALAAGCGGPDFTWAHNTALWRAASPDDAVAGVGHGTTSFVDLNRRPLFALWTDSSATHGSACGGDGNGRVTGREEFQFDDGRKFTVEWHFDGHGRGSVRVGDRDYDIRRGDFFLIRDGSTVLRRPLREGDFWATPSGHIDRERLRKFAASDPQITEFYASTKGD